MEKEYVYIFLHLEKTGGTTINGHLHNQLEWDEEFVHIGPWGDLYREDKGREPFHKRNLRRRKKANVIAGHDVWYGIHKLIPDKIPRYFTVLRDPTDRLVSLFNHSTYFEDFKNFFKITRKNDIVKFYYTRLNRYRLIYYKYFYFMSSVLNNNIKIANNLTENLDSKNFWETYCFNQVKETLDNFWKVIPLKYLDNELKIIFDKVGVPKDNWKNYRVSGKKESSVKEIFPYAKEENYVQKKLEVNDEIRKKVQKKNPLDQKIYEYFKKEYEKEK